MAKTSSDGKVAPVHRRRGGEHRVSLGNFAARKGQIRALEEFHNRKRHKRMETAKALRKYKKAMKQEGFEAGSGASRKRTKESEGEAVEGSNDGYKSTQMEQSHASHDVARRPKKSNPFEKSLRKAKQNEDTAMMRRKDQMNQEEEKQKRLRERKNQTRLLQKRTRKGQPILKHAIDGLLHKLEKQQR